MPRPKWKPTAEELKSVEMMAGVGMTQEQIGTRLGRSKYLVAKHAHDAYDKGRADAHFSVSSMIFKGAMKGVVPLMIFYAKTQMGWREVNRTELTGPDGTPIAYANATDKELDDELDRLLADRENKAPADRQETASTGESQGAAGARGALPDRS